MEPNRTRSPSLLHAAALALCTAALTAQQPPRPGPVPVPVPVPAVTVPAPAPGTPAQPGDEKPAKKPPVDAERMKLFGALVLDRRPSTILKAWADEEPKGIEEDPELALPKDPPEAPKAPVAPTAPTPVEPKGKDGAPPTAQEVEQAAAAQKKAEEEHQKKMAEFQKAQADYQKVNANHQKLVAEHAAKKKAIEQKRLAREMQILARNVTLGRWDRLPAALAAFGEKGAEQAYVQLLAKLVQSPKSTTNTQLVQFAEFNSFSFDDILALTEIAPGGLKKKQAAAFPALLGLAFKRGHHFDEWVKRLRTEVARPEKERRFDRRMAALFLAAQRKDIELGEFLPSLAELEKAADREGLNLLARHHIAVYDKEKKAKLLEQAWTATLAALAIVDVEPKDTAEAEAKKPDGKAETAEAKHPGQGAAAGDPAQTATAVPDPAAAAAARAEAAQKEAEAKAEALEAKNLRLAEKTEALRRAVELAPKVRDELGDAWLEESFTVRPDRGMEVIATIGGQASQGMVLRAYDTDYRLKGLQLLSSAVHALLEKAPERAEKWRESLNHLADVWLREAEHAYEKSQATQMGPYSSRDAFGNIYWNYYGSSYYSTPVKPLEPAQLLELRPDGKWREMLEDSVRPKYDTTVAELYLKMREEKLAFPYIEQLAKTDTKRANELAKRFLTVWIENNDPNSSNNRSSIYNYSYGFNRRASGIPLTRSRQERNLRDLAEWVARLRAVPNIELDTELLLRAFTSSHSPAEVYRIETMEGVFGSLGDLEPKTLAKMAQTMRGNLATTWRIPAVQNQAGTNRKQKDIEQEVQKGYALAALVLGRALQSHPDDWALKVAQAAMVHDLNNFQNRIQKSQNFAETRRQALAMFEAAAKSYVKKLPELRADEETSEPFDFWFQATLGASDIPAIDQNTILARHEIPKIKAVLDGIPGEAGKRHRSKFANSLFTRLSNVNPAVKNRYLESGFAIVGDHPQAASARKVYDFYKDLLTEIQMVTTVDGPTDVGTEPFGVRVDLRYTRQIERESGGFAKYLQNQANNVSYYYNYGRPEENYRDKFEESIRATLEEQFEVMSVTFNNEKVASKATDEFGWRRTPYAYLLLKARGKEVDRIPPLKMDLDFNDVTGYVVLPVVSPVVPIDASAPAQTRPYENLSITEILDERKSAEGVLNLEVKADSRGLVPSLETVMNVDPADFEVDQIVDQGVTVSRYDDDEDSIRAERTWLISMKPRKGVENPTLFRFPTPKAEGTQVLYQRYDDADLVTAKSEIRLQGKYSEPEGLAWWWFALPVVVLLLAVLWFGTRRPAPIAETAGLKLPSIINPLTVLGLLEELRRMPGLDEAKRTELAETIARIELHYFGGRETAPPDLREIAEEWLRRA